MRTMYTVTPWLNANPSGILDGFDGRHALTTAPDLKLRVSEFGAQYAADIAFAIGNREGTDLDHHSWPTDVRSISVGDLLAVQGPDGTTFFAVAPKGWIEVPEPSNPIVLFAGTDWVTSR